MQNVNNYSGSPGFPAPDSHSDFDRVETGNSSATDGDESDATTQTAAPIRHHSNHAPSSRPVWRSISAGLSSPAAAETSRQAINLLPWILVTNIYYSVSETQLSERSTGHHSAIRDQINAALLTGGATALLGILTTEIGRWAYPNQAFGFRHAAVTGRTMTNAPSAGDLRAAVANSRSPAHSVHVPIIRRTTEGLYLVSAGTLRMALSAASDRRLVNQVSASMAATVAACLLTHAAAQRYFTRGGQLFSVANPSLRGRVSEYAVDYLNGGFFSAPLKPRRFALARIPVWPHMANSLHPS